MRLLIDANILLDVLQKKESYSKDSSAVWKLCKIGQAKGYVPERMWQCMDTMDQRKKLPVGFERFEEIRAEGFYYVDKTAMIQDLFYSW